MTPASFSTSSSSRDRISGPVAYLAFIALGSVATVALVLFFSVLSFRNDLVDTMNSRILHFQIGKLENAGEFDTLFVGDSSLGALLDTATWEHLSGRPTLQVALTGSYGYAGSHGMIRRAITRNRPVNIVLIHASDMMSRNVAPMGHVLARPVDDPPKLSGYAMTRTWLSFHLNSGVLAGALKGAFKRALGLPDTRIAGGYLRLRDEIGAAAEVNSRRYADLRPDSVKNNKTQFLQEIRDLCEAEGTNCIYAHGPVYDGACRAIAEFLDAANRQIRDAGFEPVAGTPVCVPQEDLADTIDHVRPDRKAHYTERYYRLVSPYLQ